MEIIETDDDWTERVINAPFRAKRDKYKSRITPEWVLSEIKRAYESWTYGPEPEITATELARIVYPDCAEERDFAPTITPHTDRILRKLRDDGKLEASETIKNGRSCLVYNRPDYRNPNNVRSFNG